MKKIIHSVIPSLFIVILFCLSSCSTTESAGDISGTYTYTGYDENSATIISGTLQLEIRDSANVTGSWQFNAVTYAEDIGPQIGAGELEGAFTDGLLIINLNPGWADNNVMLVGALNNNTYSGVWQYIGFPGVINEGTFSAVKN